MLLGNQLNSTDFDRIHGFAVLKLYNYYGESKSMGARKWVRGNTRFISSVDREISCLTREIYLVFPSTLVLFCLLYKLVVFSNIKYP